MSAPRRSRAGVVAACAFLAGAALGVSGAASATNFLDVYHDALTHDPSYQQAYATYMAARE
ncbi:MAG: hypothetical protein ACYCT1_07205, partial [Steroidobacteraceae bacterium]